MTTDWVDLLTCHRRMWQAASRRRRRHPCCDTTPRTRRQISSRAVCTHTHSV